MRPYITCSVEVYEGLTANVIVQTLATVLLQLNLFDVDALSNHLLSCKEAVGQRAVDCNRPPLLGDLVPSLK